MADEELTPDEIEQRALGPKRITGDEGTVEERPIQELIDADRYKASREATSAPFGIRFGRMKFPGTQ